MFIIKVLPIEKAGKIILSYFHSKKLDLGQIVIVPIGRKEVQAVVLSVSPLPEDRLSLRKQAFQLKSIIAIQDNFFIERAFILSIIHTARYYNLPLSKIFYEFMPQVYLNLFLNREVTVVKNKKHKEVAIIPDITAFQKGKSARFEFYKDYIRSSFSRKESICFVFPTIKEVEKFHIYLKSVRQDHVYALSSALSEKDNIHTIKKITKLRRPVVLVTTPSFLISLPKNMGTIIMEKDGSSSYRRNFSIKYDSRIFIEAIARFKKIKLMRADSCLGLETYYRAKMKTIHSEAPFSFHLNQDINYYISKVRSANKRNIFSPDSIKILQRNIKNKKRSFVFVPRKGGSVVTTCQDCGQTLLCPHCLNPAQRDEIGDSIVYKCKRCKTENINFDHLCTSCGSHRFNYLGVGMDVATRELKQFFPKIKVFQIDKDKTKSHKKAVSVIRNFEDTASSILVGTQMAISHMVKQVDTAIILSIDSLLSLPKYSIYEDVVYKINEISELCKHDLLLQTRNTADVIQDIVSRGSFRDFFTSELSMRKKYFYPPFYTVLVFTFSINLSDLNVANMIDKVKTIFHNKAVNVWVESSLMKKQKELLISVENKFWDDFVNKRNINSTEGVLQDIVSQLPLNFSGIRE